MAKSKKPEKGAVIGALKKIDSRFGAIPDLHKFIEVDEVYRGGAIVNITIAGELFCLVYDIQSKTISGQIKDLKNDLFEMAQLSGPIEDTARRLK